MSALREELIEAVAQAMHTTVDLHGTVHYPSTDDLHRRYGVRADYIRQRCAWQALMRLLAVPADPVGAARRREQRRRVSVGG